ncbi:hypothetical protein ACWDXD_24845 [Streptomyces sp. NPDC003314]
MSHPTPTTEFGFHVSDIPHAAAPLLGRDWRAESGAWGTCGFLLAPDDREYTIGVLDLGPGAVDRPLYVATAHGNRRVLPHLTIGHTFAEIARAVADAVREMHRP